ncbi:RDD family protein [Oceaniferula spumae]
MSEQLSNTLSPTDTGATTTPTQSAVATTSTAIAGQASIGQRAGAYLIDVAVVIAINVVLSFTIGMMSSTLASLASFAVGIGYMVTRDSLPFLDGQSIGKRLIGLRAVTADGQSLSNNWNPGLIRNAILVVPLMPLVELIILFTKQEAPEGLLRLGDQWAGTKVITVK